MATQYRIRESGLHVPPSTQDVEMRERIAELEFAQEDRGWVSLGDGARFEFSREFHGTIMRLARIMWLKNPLVRRGVNVKADYVYGRGMNVSAHDQDINAVIQAFLDDDRNRVELTTQAARIDKERNLTIDGNLYLVFFVHPSTGRVRVRSLPAEEITEVITNPKDSKETWYFRREWTERIYDPVARAYRNQQHLAYYRDWRYRPADGTFISDVAEGVVYHIKTGGLSDWRFGLSEIYPAIDWARAYKTFLENWSTIVAAYAKFAFQVTTKGGTQARKAAAAKLGAGVTPGLGGGPGAAAGVPPAAGSTFISDENIAINPVRTAGATTEADDGRRLLLMVAAAFGLPETFFGDVSVGTLATAESLDRPTELMIGNRQEFWRDIWHDIVLFVIRAAVAAPQGKLRSKGALIVNEYGEEEIEFDTDVDVHIDIDFPAIVETDTAAYIGSVVQASPYIPDPREVSRLVLTALGVNDLDELLDRMYPKQDMPPVVDTLAPEVDPLAQAVEALKTATSTLREAMYERR